MVSHAFTTFEPTPEAAEPIIRDLTDPSIALTDVAARHNTSLEALILWLETPDTAARIDAIDSAVARRARLVATNYLPNVAQALARILDEQQADADQLKHGRSDHDLSNLKQAEFRRRKCETTRRAASLLFRLANFHPTHSAPTARPATSGASRPPGRNSASAAPFTPGLSIVDLIGLLAARDLAASPNATESNVAVSDHGADRADSLHAMKAANSPDPPTAPAASSRDNTVKTRPPHQPPPSQSHTSATPTPVPRTATKTDLHSMASAPSFPDLLGRFDTADPHNLLATAPLTAAPIFPTLPTTSRAFIESSLAHPSPRPHARSP
jgi:hypothetical protein